MSYTKGNSRRRRRSVHSNTRAAGASGYPSGVDQGTYEDYRIDPDGASSYTSDSIRLGESAIETSRRKRKRKKRIMISVISAVVVLVLAGAGAAFAYINVLNDNLHAGLDEGLLDALMPVDTPSDPFYVLLLGTDGSSERLETDEYANGNFRSDSMMLVRIDPKSKKVAMLSIPRDTKVNLGKYGTQKINAAHAFGGPALAVKTVSQLAGVPISHYAELNFDGFRDIVNALGGVEVNVAYEINDDMAGGHLDAGLQTLNGDQALILCRSRHNYDDVGDGDLLRAANQRLVMSAIAQKILSVDPISMASTVATLTEHVITDMDVSEIVAVAQNMRGLDPATDIYTGTAPTESEYTGSVWYEILDTKEFKKMIERIDSGLPPAEEDQVDEYTGIVISSTGDAEGEAAQSRDKQHFNITRNAQIRIRNGNGQSGVCSEAQSKLEEMGYKQFDTGNADSFNYDTTLVIYKDSSKANEARQIAEQLGVGKAMADDGTFLFDSDFLVVIGQDWS